jgi:multidrug transporter EmrE-like cation transporter
MNLARHEARAKLLSAVPSAAETRRSTWFVHGALFACLCLQRFGLTLGSSVVFASLPVFAGLVTWMLSRRQATFSVRSLTLYSLAGSSFLVSTLVAIVFRDPRVENSMGSLAAILFTYALLTVRPNERFDGSRTIDIFLGYARVAAVLGIAQYLLQFVGVRVFSFSMTLPFLKPVLVEHQFAFNPLLSYGSTTLRSNGFFLVEPSTFSQVLVLAMASDFFIKNTYRYMPLYGTAYAVSHSGTGVLCLTVAVLVYGFTSPKSMMRTIAFGCAGLVLVGVLALSVPSVFETFARRAGEVGSSGSSGYARYVAQFTALKAFAPEARALVGYGPGATERSIYWVNGSGNPGMKLFIDYGIIGLTLFATFLASTFSRARHVILPILCLSIFQLGGGALLFSPFVVLHTILCVWSAPSSTHVAFAATPMVSARGRWTRAELPVIRSSS